MKIFSIVAISVMLWMVVASDGHAYEVDTYDFLMPNVWPHKDELYLCTPIRISSSNFYIVGFQPKASMHTAHHMLLYGCLQPGGNGSVWNCGEMQNNDDDNLYPRANPCSSGSQIVYAWARDAPSLQLPTDVGFLVGGDSPIQYMVLQVHYMSKFPEGKTDNSGVYLKYTKERLRRQAGVLLLGTGGYLLPRREEHMETACAITEDKVIHPFAFRTHTHSLGRVVSGYAVVRSARGDQWRLLGKKDPQLPQMFYPVADSAPLRRGDVLAARCTMNNTHAYPVKIGPTNKDEMCNFYLMYWVEGEAPLQRKYCFTNGPPYYYWENAPEGFNLIPDRDASQL
ncbi:PREDICTED: peptidylglycine alpha-hydroxylating monooxygenase [Papilio polytes]|uniref:peptidylglycine alpha-hydroxylating monooxygenase n=1 Tax=Papilio polytes TaxID=76194 RepID=UPI000675CF7E|nr:PREDICTED: peptidylglycine alpha-hydroxylating monooxygenase [Papilio polytes]